VIKLCECGCGKPAPIAKHAEGGWAKGESKRFIHGHHARITHGRWPERFWEKVDKNGPLPSAEAIKVHPEIAGQRCWLYGKNTAHRISVRLGDGREQNAPRVAWFLETGMWPTPCCLHRCDVPNCIRFSHLFEGTLSDNTRDMIRKKRDRIVGARHKLAKLTDEQVAEIRREGAPWVRAKGRRYRGTAVLLRRIAKRFGITKSGVWTILRDKTRKLEGGTGQ